MANNRITKRLFLVILISFSLFILISGCNKQKTHFECSDGSCIKVNGTGTDECTDDSDCYHKECSNGNCVNVNSPGTDECTGDGHGVCYHKECSNGQCIKVNEGGDDSCINDDDCKLCIEEGEEGSIFKDDVCCEGLEIITNSWPDNGECMMHKDGSFICAKCGNGECGNGENYCNCPDDCKECRDEEYGCTIEVIPCCNGLKEVPLAFEENGRCIVADCGSICRPCGNGICDENENKCNCPDDCAVESKCEELNSILTEAYVEAESAKGQEEIEITPITYDKVKVSIPTKTGGDLDFYAFYSINGGQEIALGSPKSQIITSAEKYINKDDRFIISSGEYTHLIEVTNFDSTNSKVAFKDIGLGTTFKITAADQVSDDGGFSLDGYEYHFTAYYDEQKIRMENLGTDSEGEIWTPSGAKLTISLYNNKGMINFEDLSEELIRYDDNIIMYVSDPGTSEDEKITVGMPMMDDPTFLMKSWESKENYYNGYTRWGTHVVYETPIGGQNSVTITYPKTEAEANVYITSSVVSTTGGTTIIEGDAFKISTSTDKLNLYECLSSKCEVLGGPLEKITKNELNALADGSITNEKGTYQYHQEIILPEDAKVVHEIDSKQSDDPKLYLKFAANKPGYIYRLSFPTAIRSDIDSNNHFDDLDDKRISMLGKEFTIVRTRHDWGEIKLMTGSIKDTMEEGDSKTYTINGIDYVVEVIIIADIEPSMVKFKVNGETTDAMQEGESFKLADGTEIAVKSLEVNEPGDVVGDIVEFYLGAEIVTFRDRDFETSDWGGTLTVGGEEIKNVGVNIVGTFPDGDVAISEIEVRWTPDKDYYVPIGGRLSDQLDVYYKDQLFLRNMDFEFTEVDFGTTGSTTTYTSCGDAKYDKRADFNNDGQIDPEDKTIFTENDGNEEWCTEQLEKTFDPCGQTELICTDSDGGKDYYVKGEITGELVSGPGSPSADMCIGDIWLRELFCNDEGKGEPIGYECPNGCDDGACIDGEAEVIRINGEYTVLNENFPDDVYSSTVYFYIGSLPNKKRVRTLLNFDLTGLEGKEIKKVELVIKKVNLTEQDEANAGQLIEIHKVTSPWRSETISWNNHPKFDTTVIDSQEVTGNGEYTFSITTIIQSLIKHESGVLLKAEDEETTNLKKFDEAYLNIWYTEEEEPKTCKQMGGKCRYIGGCKNDETEADYECPFWSKCCMPD